MYVILSTHIQAYADCFSILLASGWLGNGSSRKDFDGAFYDQKDEFNKRLVTSFEMNDEFGG